MFFSDEAKADSKKKKCSAEFRRAILIDGNCFVRLHGIKFDIFD
jgi:hypothetical protein